MLSLPNRELAQLGLIGFGFATTNDRMKAQELAKKAMPPPQKRGEEAGMKIEKSSSKVLNDIPRAPIVIIHREITSLV